MDLLTAFFTLFSLLFAMKHGMVQALSLDRNVMKTSNKPLLPALFAFGDSIFDPGNNNDLPTTTKSNFLPYGMDFVTHKPTGRFCNGKIPTDFIGMFTGIWVLILLFFF